MMQSHIFRFVFILGFFPLMSVKADDSKRALLVAVGNYPVETGWQKINSLNDIDLIKKVLFKQGFQENEIVILAENEATKAGILAAIRTELLGKVRPGGVAYFHFSGHGQQVADDNGDEPDGYDEAIVPINSPLHFQPGVYEGENLIRDDELGAIFREIRQVLGPKGLMQVMLDACHSGTGTRGFGVARGTQVKMASSGHTGRGQDQSFSASFGPPDEAGLAPMVAFFGAAQNQLNYETTDEEGRNVGSLSYAFSKRMASAAPTLTYRGLFEQIRLEMSAIAPRQQPKAEGMLDREVFGGRIIGAPEYLRIKQWNDPGSVVIEAGWLQGIHEGSVVGFYPPETRNTAHTEAYTKGTVSFAGAALATVTLEQDLDQETALAAWAVVLERNFGDMRLNVKNNLPPDNPVTPILEKRLEKMPVTMDSPNADLYLTLESTANSREASMQLIGKNDEVVQTFPADLRPELLADRLVKEMMAFSQARFLKQLEMSSNELLLKFELIPVKINRQTMTEESRQSIREKMDSSGTARFREGDVVKIKVTNDGYKPAYFTLLDIQPDNKVNVLLPQSNESPEEYSVPPGRSIEFNRYFEFGPPYGTEVFKLIATDQAIDLRPISANRGSATKSNQHGFERLFSQTFFNEETSTRGGKTISLSSVQVHVESFSFLLEE